MTEEIKVPVDGAMRTEQFEATMPEAPVPADPLPAPTDTGAKPDPLLGADSDALAGDRKMLVTMTETKEGTEKPVDNGEGVLQPDNSPEALEQNRKVNVARAFVRAKGFPDHLYSDATVIAEHERFLEFMKEHANEDFKMSLDQPKTYMHAPKGELPQAVKSAEYATIEGAKVPHYEDHEKSDWPVPVQTDKPQE